MIGLIGNQVQDLIKQMPLLLVSLLIAGAVQVAIWLLFPSLRGEPDHRARGKAPAVAHRPRHAAAPRQPQRRRAAAHPHPPAALTTSPLPADLRDFVGRRAELDRVRKAARASQVIVVSGAPGTGTSAFAIHAARAVARDRDVTARYIDLRALASRPPVRAERQPAQTDTSQPATALDWSDASPALLVLDNAADAAQVSPLLGGFGPDALVLIAAHGDLCGITATRIPLPPLPITDAVRLLESAAGAVYSTTAQQSAAAELAGAVGCNPTAVRMLAGLMVTWDCDPVACLDRTRSIGTDPQRDPIWGVSTLAYQRMDADTSGYSSCWPRSPQSTSTYQQPPCSWAFRRSEPAQSSVTWPSSDCWSTAHSRKAGTTCRPASPPQPDA
jgi:hypothetical protein